MLGKGGTGAGKKGVWKEGGGVWPWGKGCGPGERGVALGERPSLSASSSMDTILLLTWFNSYIG